jgi:hypothetical protein
MEPLYRQALKRSLFGSIVFLILIFLPAGTLAYRQGWVFFAVFASSTTALPDGRGLDIASPGRVIKRAATQGRCDGHHRHF